MKKRTLLAALLVVPMGAAFAQETSVEATKNEAMQNLEAIKSAAGQMNLAATTLMGELQGKYREMATKTANALEALRTGIAQTSDSTVARNAAEKTKDAARALEAIVIAIKSNRVAEAADQAKNAANAIEKTADTLQGAAAGNAARAVKEAAADIQASAR